MNNICIILPYFGKFPAYFGHFLKSCQGNPTIDWYVPTDCTWAGACPENVHFVQTDLPAIKRKIEQKLGYEVSLKFPYKLCDFRPAFGEIFSEELSSYMFWGYCDMDVLWGDIRKFLTDAVLDSGDVFFNLGHLSIFRNCATANELYKKVAPGKIGPDADYRKVFATDENCNFEEYPGLYRIIQYHKINNVNPYSVADLSPHYYRTKFDHDVPGQNYQYQIFCWYQGRVFQRYWNDGKVSEIEHTYVHFQKRPLKIPDLSDRDQMLVISPREMIYVDWAIDLKDLQKLNPGSMAYDLKMFYNRVKGFAVYYGGNFYRKIIR